MLRKIIAAYKTVFLLSCAIMFGGSIVLGFTVVMWGQTVQERWSGIGIMVGGAFFALMLVGNLALILENNELLRRVADRLGDADDLVPSKVSKNVNRSSQPVQRREPTL